MIRGDMDGMMMGMGLVWVLYHRRAGAGHRSAREMFIVSRPMIFRYEGRPVGTGGVHDNPGRSRLFAG